jgi:hypothetical protein
LTTNVNEYVPTVPAPFVTATVNVCDPAPYFSPSIVSDCDSVLQLALGLDAVDVVHPDGAPYDCTCVPSIDTVIDATPDVAAVG